MKHEKPCKNMFRKILWLREGRDGTIIILVEGEIFVTNVKFGLLLNIFLSCRVDE